MKNAAEKAGTLPQDAVLGGHVELWDRVFFDDKGEATRWLRSWNKGASWLEVDCSIFPNSRPPFLRLRSDGMAWIEQKGWVPA